MGTTRRIEIKLETRKLEGTEGQSLPIVGSQIEVYGRIYDLQNDKPESEWVPIRTAKHVSFHVGADGFAEAKLTVRPVDIDNLSGYLSSIAIDSPDPHFS